MYITLTLIATGKAVNRMTNKLTINKYLFAGLLVLLLAGGAFGGYFYTGSPRRSRCGYHRLWIG